MIRVQTPPRWPTRHTYLLLTCLLELVGVSQAWTIDFAAIPLDGPSASATEIHALGNAGQLIGTFWDVKGTHGLICFSPVEAICTKQFMRPLDVWINGAKAMATLLYGITTAGQIAGSFVDFKGESHGLLCALSPATLECNQVDVSIDHVLMTNTLILGIHEQGHFVGSYSDSQFRIRGFLFIDGSFTRVDVPGAFATVVSGIATTSGKISPTIVGFFLDARWAIHGFLCRLPVSQHCFTTFDVMLNGVPQTTTQAMDINTQQIVGSFRDAIGNTHGYVCKLPLTAVCFIQLDVKNGTQTHILSINDRGQISGHFRDTNGLQRGFTTMADFSLSERHNP